MGQHLVFRGHGSRGILHDHKAAVDTPLGGEEPGQTVGKGSVDHTLNAPLGDTGDLRTGDTQEIEGQRHGLSVEVSAGNHRLVLTEQQRIVRYGIELNIHFALDKSQSVPHRAVNLGNAAQSIGVLHSGSLATLQDLTAIGEQTEIFCHLNLADMAPDSVHALLEGIQLAGEGRQGQRADQIRQTSCLHGIIQV